MAGVMRRLLTSASAMSLLLCIATILLWTWSEVKHPPTFSWGDPRTAVGYSVSLYDGTISFQKGWGSRTIFLSGGEFAGPRLGNDGGWDAYGLHFHLSEWRKFDSHKTMLPGSYGHSSEFWFQIAWPLVLSLPLSIRLGWTSFARPTRRQRRIRDGRCPTCGYDLRATPGRCPECGMASMISKVRA
jgi:hypothetical protein